MTAPVSNTSGSSGLDYAALGLAGTNASGGKDALDQQDFLELMTVQMKNQNPLKPLENTEFFAQIAQFSTVSGISKLQSAFSDLATQLSGAQTLQAAALIGRDVLVPGETGLLGDTGLAGAVETGASGEVQIAVRDASGALVRTLSLGTQPAGQTQFNWNGTDADGNSLAEGRYSISASVIGADGGSQAATTYVSGRVDSVASTRGGLTVQLQGLGDIAFSQVIQIR
jgi:flagellar basal-body rod modification protein FlgD